MPGFLDSFLPASSPLTNLSTNPVDVTFKYPYIDHFSPCPLLSLQPKSPLSPPGLMQESPNWCPVLYACHPMVYSQNK